ncbi:MAG: hypothetical protein ABFD66_09040 [Smithella sp.]
MHRRAAPKVRNGKVQKKNNHELTPSYWNTDIRDIVIDREKPGVGHKHIIKRKDIIEFIKLLPEWNELSKDLNAIVLSKASPFADGRCYSEGVIKIGAWPKDLWVSCTPEYFSGHKDIFDKLNLKYEKVGNMYLCKFDESQVRAYQLLHIFLHELGHHHDRITTKSKRRSSRGEAYAEEYARKYESLIWTDYFNRFT